MAGIVFHLRARPTLAVAIIVFHLRRGGLHTHPGRHRLLLDDGYVVLPHPSLSLSWGAVVMVTTTQEDLATPTLMLPWLTHRTCRFLHRDDVQI